MERLRLLGFENSLGGLRSDKKQGKLIMATAYRSLVFGYTGVLRLQDRLLVQGLLERGLGFLRGRCGQGFSERDIRDRQLDTIGGYCRKAPLQRFEKPCRLFVGTDGKGGMTGDRRQEAEGVLDRGQFQGRLIEGRNLGCECAKKPLRAAKVIARLVSPTFEKLRTQIIGGTGELPSWRGQRFLD